MFLILILTIFLLADIRCGVNRGPLFGSSLSKVIFGFILIVFIVPHLLYVVGLFWPGLVWPGMPLMRGIGGRFLANCFI